MAEEQIEETAVDVVDAIELDEISSLDGEEEIEFTLLDMNHYVLLKICRSVKNFFDQLSLAQTCTQISDIYTKEIWCRSSPGYEVGPTSEIAYLKYYEEDYKFFVHAMQKHFSYFCTYDNNNFPTGLRGYLNMMKSYGIHEFPAVKMCILEGSGDVEEEDIITLAKFLTNLKSLILFKEKLTTRTIGEFHNLQELFLIDIPVIASHLITSIEALKKLRVLDLRSCTNLRLPYIASDTLEVLRLHIHTLRTILKHVLRLPKLRILEARYCDRSFVHLGLLDNDIPLTASQRRRQKNHRKFQSILPMLLKKKASEIIALNVNNSAMHLAPNWDDRLDNLNMSKLRKLLFNGWKTDDMFMERHIPNRSQLKTLGFGDWKRLTTTRLANIVAYYKDLDFLEVSNFRVDGYVLQRIVEKLEYEGRIKPLTVWNWSQIKYNLSKEELAYWSENKRLQLYLKPGQSPNTREFRRDVWGFEMEFDNTSK